MEAGSVSGDARPPPHPADIFAKDLEVTLPPAKAAASFLRHITEGTAGRQVRLSLDQREWNRGDCN